MRVTSVWKENVSLDGTASSAVTLVVDPHTASRIAMAATKRTRAHVLRAPRVDIRIDVILYIYIYVRLFFPNALPPPLMHADDNVSKSHFFATSSPRARPSTKTPPMHGFGTLCSASLSCEFRPRFFFPLPFHLGMNHLPGAVDRSPVRWNKANTSVCVCVCVTCGKAAPLGMKRRRFQNKKQENNKTRTCMSIRPAFLRTSAKCTWWLQFIQQSL